MATKLRNLKRWRSPSPRQVGAFAFLAFLGLIALSIFIVPPAFQSRRVFAAPAQAKSEPWLKIKCLETEVEEGDDFRLEVGAKFDTDSTSPTMRVFWYTEAITADETDYEHLYAEGQASNAYQSRTGKMGRDFHTREDLYPEADETFKVRFNNSEDHGHDGECIITIHDDDGVGIYDLEITSEPRELDAGGGPVIGYTAGDWIEITAKFTGPVTNLNPDTMQRAEYAGLYLQVGENRRVARIYQGDGTDTLVFAYQVQEEDLDANGISVESGGPGTGLFYNQDNRDSGLWPIDPDTGRVGGRINRLFHGLEDDPEHMVVQAAIEEPTIIELDPVPDPVPNPTPTMTSFEQEILAKTNTVVFHQEQHGELTADDGGRDWFSFNAESGEHYIIELKNRWYVTETDSSGPGWAFQYIQGHLLDPSILEVVNNEGDQVLGERDQGGFMGNFARAFFTPNEDGTYYAAVGAGAQDRRGQGNYTISVRVDDHADDYHPNPQVAIQPGGSIRATIDSDVAPDDPGLNPWDWLETSGGNAVPLRGDESLNDRDVFRLRIPQAGTYRVSVSDAPDGVGVWSIMVESGSASQYLDTVPAPSMEFQGEPGDYFVEIGTPYRSEGNTGRYTVTLEKVSE